MTTTEMILSQPWIRTVEGTHFLGDTKKTDDRRDLVTETALRELREDDHTRLQCLEQFKDWIRSNKDIDNVIIDNNFLLRFLRTKKFSLPMAQQTLLKYLNLRQKFSEIFFNMDCRNNRIDQLVEAGYMFVSPVRDRHGRRVIFIIPKFCDPSRFTSHDMSKLHCIIYETLLNDEENQIMGVSYMVDFHALGASHVAMWSITEFATLVKWGEQSFPIRHKSLHLVNLSPSLKYVIDFGKSRVSDKLKQRMHTDMTLEAVQREIGKDALPKEYGGLMPMSQMIDLWKHEMIEAREKLLSLDKMTLISDRGIIGRKTKCEEMQGSFRKLNID